jgi:integrase
MTAKRTPENERVKRRYLQFLKEVKGRDEASLDAAAKALERFDHHNRRRDFRKFHVEQAIDFKRHLSEQRNARTGEVLSASTINSTLSALRAFIIWLADQTDYRARIRYVDADYFNPPDNLVRIATAHRFRPCATLAQIRAVVDAMPAETEIEQRDRALVAFTILTGARDRAIVSFKLKHIDLERGLIEQDGREVATKRGKTFTTWFFPVGEEIEKIVADWVLFLRNEKGFSPDAPVFPKTRVEPGPDLEFAATGLDRAHWANADPVRAIFREAFARAGLPYFNPHSFRNTLMQLAYERKLDAEQLKAWSQNLGHESVLTTFCSYGTISPPRQAELLRGLAESSDREERDLDPEEIDRVIEQLKKLRKAG